MNVQEGGWEEAAPPPLHQMCCLSLTVSCKQKVHEVTKFSLF